jgi:hypothetical protein
MALGEIEDVRLGCGLISNFEVDIGVRVRGCAMADGHLLRLGRCQHCAGEADDQQHGASDGENLLHTISPFRV